MKKYLLILALAVMGLTGCNKLVEQVDPIVGQWHSYSRDTFYGYNCPAEQLRGQTISTPAENVMILKADHTGTWGTTPIEWEKNGNQFTFRVQNYTTGQTYTIEDLSQDRLVLSYEVLEYATCRIVYTRDK